MEIGDPNKAFVDSQEVLPCLALDEESSYKAFLEDLYEDGYSSKALHGTLEDLLA